MKRAKKSEPGHKLEQVGTVTLPLHSDRYVDAEGVIIEGKSAMWLRFPMFSAKSKSIEFDVCSSGGAIIIAVKRAGQSESHYFHLPLSKELLEQIEALTPAGAK